ncbi:hypothetical protein PVAP13_5NG275540 [Panicum virgatum]|uniref:Uncharacterized protein n=1 Tax=Panicum virgatum TaxID=38727 RepID=A0A8T0RZU5_PANVG|nr:hypothetical protein PVAP13_5NG275540 [Panicum virgatum]
MATKRAGRAHHPSSLSPSLPPFSLIPPPRSARADPRGGGRGEEGEGGSPSPALRAGVARVRVSPAFLAPPLRRLPALADPARPSAQRRARRPGLRGAARRRPMPRA